MLSDYRVRQRDYLLEISRAMTARLDLTEVLRLIGRNAAEILSGNAALIALVDPDGRFRIRAVYGVQQPLLDQLQPMLAAIENPIEAANAMRRDLSAIANRIGLGLLKVVSLPLKIGEDFLGEIYIVRFGSNSFGPDESQILQAFADQAAIAVNNARLYQQLSYEKQRLGAILEFSADGVVIMDSAHRILSINKTLSHLLRIEPGDAMGKPFESVVRIKNKRAGMTLEEAEAHGYPLLAKTSHLFVEADLIRADGSAVPVEINFAPLFDGQGHLVNLIADVHDLTRFKIADEMKNTFISAVSHELKTPVALIKGFASTLRRNDANWDENTTRDSLKVIEEESDRLNELIENLLDASRAQAGNFKLARVELDIDDLVVRVVNKMKTQTHAHSLVADVASDMPLVFADEARITQVLTNLISNAVKYSPPQAEIRITGSSNEHEVIISVKDHGAGISKEEQTRLFERFYRSDSAIKKSIPGTGLGLYLSKSIIEAHGGKIWVESDGKHGSTFSFSLPRVEVLS
jgi:PAS domain S-box-containing protein